MTPATLIIPVDNELHLQTESGQVLEEENQDAKERIS